MADSLDLRLVKSFAQKLAGNEKKFRDRAVKKLKRWIATKSRSPDNGFDKEGLLKVWKGLHYCMWMSDKPLVQEELSHSLSSLIHDFASMDTSLLFFEAALMTEGREWSKLDAFRMDKFMMFVRHILRQGFALLKKHDWEHISDVTAILSRTVCCPTDNDAATSSDGIKYHVADLYLDELQTVADGELSDEQIVAFFQPYNNMLLHVKNPLLAKHIVENVFIEAAKTHIRAREAAMLKQAEEEEKEEEDEEEEEMDIDAEEEEEEEGEEVLHYDLESIADSLFQASSQKSEPAVHNRKLAYSVVARLKDMASADYVSPDDKPVEEGEDIGEDDVNKAVARLLKLEKQLVTNDPSKKKKKQMDAEKKAKAQKKEVADKTETSKKEKTKNKFEVAAKTKKKQTVKKAEKPTKAKATTKENLLFQGGFCDDDEENEPPAKKLVVESLKKDSKKKSLETAVTPEPELPKSPTKESKKEKKRKSLESATIASDAPAPTSATPPVTSPKESKNAKKRKSLESATVASNAPAPTPASPPATSPKESKAKKSKKRKSLESAEVAPKEAEPTRKKKRKSMGDEGEEGDIDIWIPNKKYKGAMKGMMEKQIERQSKKSPKSEAFAEFTKCSPPPPAFVKTPKNAPQKGGGEQTPSSQKKQLSIMLCKNRAQSVGDYNKALKTTPVRYDPDRKPEQGILKPSPASKPKTPKSPRTPKTPKSPAKGKSPKKTKSPKKAGKRPQAVDFF